MIPVTFYLKRKRPPFTDNHYNYPTRKVKQLCLIIPLPPPHIEHQLVAFQAHTRVNTIAGGENITRRAAAGQTPTLENYSQSALRRRWHARKRGRVDAMLARLRD